MSPQPLPNPNELDPLRLLVDKLRRDLGNHLGDAQRIDEALKQLAPHRDLLRPGDKAELLPLCSEDGQNLGTCAPRWLCHVLGLRHRCAHLLLTWQSPAMGRVMVLQVRDWQKDDSPGSLDLSAAGHVTSTSGNGEATALAEMGEELGLSADALEADAQGRRLVQVGGYVFAEERPAQGFCNAEWREVYVAKLQPDSFRDLHFADGEVAGTLWVPVSSAQRLLTQTRTPLASGLRASLPLCLAAL